MTDPLGYLAAFCTTVAFLPQALQVWRTRRTQDLSLGMFLLFTTGGTVAGVRRADRQRTIAVANVFTLLLAGYILVMENRRSSRRGPVRSIRRPQRAHGTTP